MSWFPLNFSIAISCEGELSIQTEINSSNNKSEEIATTTTTTDSSLVVNNYSPGDKLKNDISFDSNSKGQKSTSNSETGVHREYFLHSVVCQIDDGHQKNLVSLINVDQRYFRIKMSNNNNKCQREEEMMKNQWFIFNDFR